MTKYYIEPSKEQNQKSFYRKAYIEQNENGDTILFSYDTPVLKKTKSGKFFRLWCGWSKTTGKHIFAFCGMKKADFVKLEIA